MRPRKWWPIAASAVLGAPWAVPSARAGQNPDDDVPTTVHRALLHHCLQQARSQRVAIVGLGDSNQLFSASGFQDGLTVALGERWPMYASPLFGAGTNNGMGLAMSTLAVEGLPPVGAPPDLLAFNDPSFGVDAAPYGFLGAGDTLAAGTLVGMRLRPQSTAWPQNNFDPAGALRAHFTYGVSPDGGGGYFTPQFRQANSFTVLGSQVSSLGQAAALRTLALQTPAAARNGNDIEFRWVPTSGTGAHGPVFACWMQIENADEQSGFCMTTLYGVGGATARQCAESLLLAGDEHLSAYFSRIRELLGPHPVVLVRIGFGGNDGADHGPSLGPDGPFQSNSNEGVADNLRAIIGRLRAIWTLNGWDQDELAFWLVAYHRKTVEDPGFAFRPGVASVAQSDEGVGFVNLKKLGQRVEYFQHDWWDNPGSGVHLSRVGYEDLARREVDAIMTPMAYDINDDCRINTADLGVLLQSFGGADPAADLNQNGVVDTADLGLLLQIFGAACDDIP